MQEVVADRSSGSAMAFLIVVAGGCLSQIVVSIGQSWCKLMSSWEERFQITCDERFRELAWKNSIL